MSERKRIDYLDFAKGIAIISVMLGHIIDGYCWQIVSSYENFVFFAASGYFINSKNKLVPYILKKARALLLPVAFAQFVFLTIFACISFPAHGIKAVVFSLKTFFTFKAALGVTWFFIALFLATILVRLIIAIKSKLVRILLVLLCFISGVVASLFFSSPQVVYAGLCAVPFLYLGYLLREYKDGIMKHLGKYKVLISIVISAISLFYIFTPFIHKVDFIRCDFETPLDIIGPIMSVAFIFIVSLLITRKSNIISTIFTEIGKSSLYILIVHFCEMNTIPWAAVQTKLSLPFIAIIFIRLLLSLTLGYGLSKISLIRKLFGQKTGAQLQKQ